MEFQDFLGNSWNYMFLRDLGGPGPLQTINNPIGILMFSAWGRQDPLRITKNLILV